jgi:hypothetical protein
MVDGPRADADGLVVHITKPEGYIPTERTAAALDELASALREESEDEVSGFASLEIGGQLRGRMSSPAPLGFCFPMYSQDIDNKSGGDLTGTRSCTGIYF